VATTRVRWARGALGAGLLFGASCRGPEVVTKPEVPPKALAVVDAGAPHDAAPRDGSVTLAPLVPTLRDPRLAAVDRAVTDHEWPTAVQALDAAVEALRPDTRSSSERCAWDYVSGRIHTLAGDPAGAARAFDAARGRAGDGGASCPLAGYATFRAAEAYLKAGDPKTAMDRARAVAPSNVVADDAALVLASALALTGQSTLAIPIWRAALTKSPKAWVDVALPLATALLDAPLASDADVREAKDLSTRVMVEAPRIAESSGADALRKRAVERLLVHDPKTPRDLTLAERADAARVWLDAGESTKAAGVAGQLLQDPRLPKEPAVYCAVSIVRAQALGRTKAGPGTAWDDAIARCQHDPALVTALYAGAKAASGKQPALARERYAKVEELFHDHRLADDARFQSALLALSAGDEAGFTKMMIALPDDYPTGDQRTEALFRVALLRMTHGEWDAAAPLLDRIVQMSPDDQHWATAGRAEYFRARADAAMGRTADARARYAEVLTNHPFAYYMAQAYARLSEEDHELATKTLAVAFAREDSAPFLRASHAELTSQAFMNARALLGAFDIELARRELVASRATRDDADPEVGWAVARLYDEAGAVDIAHSLARRKLKDYLSHYPVGAWKVKWQIAYPKAFEGIVTEGSATNGIPKALTWAIMREESDFVADARSSSAAFGLMQLIAPTAKGVARGTGLGWDEAALKEPRVNVALGTRLLAQLRDTFRSNPTLAIAAYNGGGGAVGRWLSARGDEAFDLWVEEIPWEETRGYEKRVLSSEAAYAYLYDPGALDEVLRTAFTARGGPRGGGSSTLR
jgi:soluble lytic murein transglycosylase